MTTMLAATSGYMMTSMSAPDSSLTMTNTEHVSHEVDTVVGALDSAFSSTSVSMMHLAVSVSQQHGQHRHGSSSSVVTIPAVHVHGPRSTIVAAPSTSCCSTSISVLVVFCFLEVLVLKTPIVVLLALLLHY